MNNTPSQTVQNAEPAKKFSMDDLHWWWHDLIENKKWMSSRFEVYGYCEYARKLRHEDGETLKQENLVFENEYMVLLIAKNYLNKGLDPEALLVHGYVGLIRAAEQYQKTDEYLFLSYSIWWIRDNILKAIDSMKQ